MYQLDYILPQVAKLSRALQTKHLDLSFISSLADATLHLMMLYCLQQIGLQDAREELKAATGIKVTRLDICSFQERVGKPFIRLIKDNISSRFRSASKDMLSAFSIFDLMKVPSLCTHELPLYGDSSIQLSLDSGRDSHAKSLEGTKFEKTAIVSSDLNTEWKTYRQLLIKQPKDDISMELKELPTKDMLNKLACLFPFL